MEKKRTRDVKFATPKGKDHTLDGLYLVNTTKKEYICFDKYYKKNRREEYWEQDGKKHTSYWCMHPLSLMTAVGNGLGGGDYDGPSIDEVGRWAFDTISIENHAPEGFTEIRPVFFEE